MGAEKIGIATTFLSIEDLPDRDRDKRGQMEESATRERTMTMTTTQYTCNISIELVVVGSSHQNECIPPPLSLSLSSTFPSQTPPDVSRSLHQFDECKRDTPNQELNTV